MSAGAERLEKLQAAMADLALEADDTAFRQDPIAFAAGRGLDPGDARAFARWQRRLLTYRALVRYALRAPLPDCFPVSKALLEPEGLWEPCLDAFLEARAVQSPYYRHIHPHFVEWLAESGWGQDRYPFLLSLAHFEYLELEVLRAPEDGPVEGVFDAPAPERTAVFSAAARNLAYPWRVHEATEEAPIPAEGAALLFCHRLPDGRFQQRELEGPESAWITRLQAGEPLGAAAEAVGLPWDEARALAEDLRADGAVLGFA
ncbi:MAG TPA: putative DNA-binding domain-containing protein [Holophagaceae bacterium]|nr:putative DNA-binding domain-containing protein [Holophagaceae bacterium]